ncbi:Wzz/FepE/Etk N-terminal domain-containing protein, partial [bacterium]|nr:Wzz/FepE/Etk N-terminal domain-containing protein [bacterium]
MNKEINKAVSLTEIISVVRRRKWLVVVSLLFTLTPALIYNHKSVPVFRASTKLIFQNNDKAMEDYAFGGMNQGNFISNQIEEMKTELFAEDVFSELSTEHKNRFLQLSTFRPDMNAESFVVSQIKNNLSFTPIRGTEIINIRFDTEKPDLAQVVANTTAEVVITRNLRMRRQQFSNVKNFVDEQFEIVQRRLANAENSLKEFKENQQVTSIEDESREILQRSTKAEIVYNEVKTTKNELQERLAAIQEKLRSEKRDLTKNVVN